MPVDLNLGDTHRLVVAYDTAAATSTLYLDALTETGGTAATDVVTAAPSLVNQFIRVTRPNPSAKP